MEHKQTSQPTSQALLGSDFSHSSGPAATVDAGVNPAQVPNGIEDIGVDTGAVPFGLDWTEPEKVWIQAYGDRPETWFTPRAGEYFLVTMETSAALVAAFQRAQSKFPQYLTAPASPAQVSWQEAISLAMSRPTTAYGYPVYGVIMLRPDCTEVHRTYVR